MGLETGECHVVMRAILRSSYDRSTSGGAAQQSGEVEGEAGKAAARRSLETKKEDTTTGLQLLKNLDYSGSAQEVLEYFR